MLTAQLWHGRAGFGLLEHGQDLAVSESRFLQGTSSGKTTRKFHFWRQLSGGGTVAANRRAAQVMVAGGNSGPTVPDQQKQEKIIRCAEAYGSQSKAVNYSLNFTNKYAWTGKDANGNWVGHQITDAEVAPSSQSGVTWHETSGAIYFSDQLRHADIYAVAYADGQYAVRAVAHEFY